MEYVQRNLVRDVKAALPLQIINDSKYVPNKDSAARNMKHGQTPLPQNQPEINSVLGF